MLKSRQDKAKINLQKASLELSFPQKTNLISWEMPSKRNTEIHLEGCHVYTLAHLRVKHISKEDHSITVC